MPSRTAAARAFVYESLDDGNARKVRETATRIIGRERAIAEGKAAYLLNGIDLIAVKGLMPHGQFESWCKAELNYSKSTAERLMRTADLFGHMVESVSLKDLPRQAVARLLADPSTPDNVRTLYVARIEAGERPSTGEIREAIERTGAPIEPAVQQDAEPQTVQAEPMSAMSAARHALIMSVRLMGPEFGRFQRLIALAGPEYARHVVGITFRPDHVIDAEWSDPPEPKYPDPLPDIDPFTIEDEDPAADDGEIGEDHLDSEDATEFEMIADGVPRLNRHERRRAEKLKRGGMVH